MQILRSKEEDAAMEATINLWGVEAQIGMAVEECGEFLSALSKWRRGRVSAEEVGEEVADILLMMCQMTKLFGGDYFVQATMNAKMQRLIERIEKV